MLIGMRKRMEQLTSEYEFRGRGQLIILSIIDMQRGHVDIYKYELFV